MLSSFWSLVPRYIKSNKKTTLSMALSIVFSVILLISTVLLLSKYNNGRIEWAKENYGKYNGGFIWLEDDHLKKLKTIDAISAVGTTLPFGYIQVNDNKLELKGADATSLDMLNVKALKGHIPKEKNEIAIEKWIYDKLPNKPRINQTFEIAYDYYDPFDKCTYKKKCKFRFCGILEDLEDSKNLETGKAYVTLEMAKSITTKYHRLFEQWYTVKDSFNAASENRKIIEFVSIRGANENQFGIERPNRALMEQLENARVIRYSTIVFGILVALAAALVIYNVFSISMLNRKKHFAMLRTIGITKKEITRMLLLEALIFSIIFIPLGIVLGIGITEVIIKVIGGINFKGSIISEVTPLNIGIPGVANFLTIMAAVYNPIKRASKTSPIEALNFENSKGIVKKNISPKRSLLEKIIGYTGMIALSNLKRNKKRFVSTVIATSIGIALFIVAMYVVNFLSPVKQMQYLYTADFSLDTKSPGCFDDKVPEIIKNIKGVKAVEKYKYASLTFVGGEDLLTPEAVKADKAGKNPLTVGMCQGSYQVDTRTFGCSDELISKLRKEYSNGSKQDNVFVVQNLNNEHFTDFKDGDERTIFFNYLYDGKFNTITRRIKIDRIIDKPPFNIKSLDFYTAIFVPYKYLEDEFDLKGYQSIEVKLNDNADVEKIKDTLQGIADKQKYGQLTDYKHEIDKYKKLQLQVGALLFSLVFIILVIGLINIMNTMNINVIIRKREFGMLRALGMTKKELRSVMLKETCMYGIVSSVIGLIAGNIIVKIVYNLLRRRFILEYYIDYKLIIITLIVTILLSMSSILLPLKKVTSTEIVDAIQAVE